MKEWEWRCSFTHCLTSALDRGEWSASRPGHFIHRKRAPGTHWIGGWVGSRAVLDAVVKRKIPSPRRESNPRTPIIQTVAQRYTDWAITATNYLNKNIRLYFPSKDETQWLVLPQNYFSSGWGWAHREASAVTGERRTVRWKRISIPREGIESVAPIWVQPNIEA
jgi:hypothetical protein